MTATGTSQPPRRVAWAAALALTLLVAIFPQFALGALGPQLREDLGIDAADLGVIFAGLYAIGVVGSPLAGPMVDRIGGRRACLGLLVVAGVALAAGSLASSRGELITAMLPAGAAMAFANPGTNRWASAAPSEGQQATLVGIAQAGVQAGALAAGALAAAHALGLDWRGVLRIGAGLAVVGAVAAWRGPADRPRPGAVPALSLGALRPPPAGAWRALAIYALLMGAATAVVFAYLPTFAVDVVGLSVAAAGATTMVFGGTALLGRLGLGVLINRTGRTVRGLLVAMAVGAAGSVGLLAAGTWAPVWLWLGVVVFGATGTTWPAVAFLAAVRASPPGAAGRVAGWVAAAFYVGLWVTPPIAGQVITRVGYGPLAAVTVVGYLLALIPAAAAVDE